MSTTKTLNTFTWAFCGGTFSSLSHDYCPKNPAYARLDQHHWLYKAGYEQGRKDAIEAADSRRSTPERAA